MFSLAEWCIVASLLECLWVGHEWLNVLRDRAHPHHGAGLHVWMRLLKCKLMSWATDSWILGLALSHTNPAFHNAGQGFLADSNLVLGPRITAVMVLLGVEARSICWWTTGSIMFGFEGAELVLLCCLGRGRLVRYLVDLAQFLLPQWDYFNSVLFANRSGLRGSMGCRQCTATGASRCS